MKHFLTKFLLLLLLIIPLNFARADAVMIGGGHGPNLQQQLGNFMTSGVIGSGLTGALSFGVPNVEDGLLASGYQGDDGYIVWDFGSPPTGNYTIKDILLTNVNGSSNQDIVGFWCNGDETIDNAWGFFVPIGTQDTSVDFTVDFKCTNNIMIQSFNSTTYGVMIQYVPYDTRTHFGLLGYMVILLIFLVLISIIDFARRLFRSEHRRGY